MKRGDIWLADSGGRIGTRPVVILTRTNVINHLNKVTVAEVTAQSKGYPTEVAVGTEANLGRPSFVQADNLHTVPKQILTKHLGTLDQATLHRVSVAVVLALGLEHAAEQL